MATRFYLTNATASYNPAVTKAAWEATGGILFNKKLGTAKEGSQTTKGVNEASATTNWDSALVQFVSDPLVADTSLTGTAQYVLGVLGATSLNARSYIHVWVTQGPTTAVRGTLIANNVDTVNWPTPTPSSYAKTAIALTTVAGKRGDRIVVEVGYRAVNTSSANLGPGVLYYGGTAGDLAAADNPVSTAKSSWIEFSFDVPILAQPVTYQVSASADDTRNISGDSTFNSNAVTYHLGKFNTTTSYWNGWRWLGIPINNAATIISAKVVLFCANVNGGTTAKTKWYGVKEASATAFANNTANKPEGKTRTTAVVNKDFTTANWTTVGFQETDYIDVTTLVQEIVNQAGWVSGGNMAIVAGDNASSNTNYIGHSTFDSDPTRGAKLVLEFLTGNEPAAPSSFSRSENGGNVDLTWTDNASNELNFEIQRKRGGSPNWYTINLPAANATSYTDTNIDSGYTYTYRIRATNAAGSSVWVTGSSITISGTKAWTAKIGAWVYPGSPAQNADEEYTDGRVIHKLKPEYYTVNSSGVLVQLTDPTNGENAYNSANALEVKSFSEEQYFVVSANAANTAALVNNATNVTNAINTLVAFVQTIGFTGVELDWEGYSTWSSTTYGNYKTFANSLGTALHAVSKKLIVDGPPITNATEQGFYLWHYEDFDALAVDYIVMLLYDYQYDFGAGQSVQPTAWMRNGVAWIKSKIVDVNKIVIGMPSYGYHGTTGGFTITVDTKTQSAARTGYGTATRNADHEMTWINAGTSSVYQDTTGLNLKREDIEDEQVKNISVWHLGGNDWFSSKQEIEIPDGRIAAYSDTFNRANADDIGSTDGSGLGDPFDYDDGGDSSLFEISSNKILSHDDNSGVFYPVPVADSLIEVEVTPVTSGAVGIIGRLNFDTGNGYAAFATEDGAGHFNLSLITLTSFAPDSPSLWDSSGTYDIGSKVSLKMVGTTISVYVNDVNESGNITNSHETVGGNNGFFADSGGTLDNLAVYIYNHDPVSNNQSVNVSENTPKDITLVATDADSDPLAYKIVSVPSHGTLSEPAHVVSSDSFNRSNGDLNGSSTDGAGSSDPAAWVVVGGSFSISSNKVLCTSGGQTSLTGVSLQNFDISSKVYLTTGNNNGLIVRGGNSGSPVPGYVCYITNDDGKVHVLKGLGGGSTEIYLSSGSAFSSGDTLRFTGQGSSFNVYVNGSLLTTFSDSTYPDAGNVGLTCDTGGGFDDFSLSSLNRSISTNDILTNTHVTYTPTTDYIGSDSFTFNVNDSLADSNTATVSITVIQSVYALSDSVTVTDSLNYVVSFPLLIGDSLNALDSISKSSVRALSDSVTIDDDIESGILVTYLRTFDETVTVSDVSANVIVQQFDETVTVTDAQSKVIHSISTDSVTTSDNRVNAPHKNISDSVTATDSQGLVTEFKPTISDSITVSESAAKTVHKAITDSVTASDSASEALQRLKSLSDSVNVTDQRVTSFIKLVTNSVTVSDGQSKVFVKTVTDSVTVSDSLSPSVTTKIITDSITVSDAEVKTVTKTRTESVQIIDNFNYTIVFPLVVSDQITFTDANQKTVVKPFSDSVTVTDNKTQVTVITINDTVTITDVASKSVTHPLADSVNITDNQTEFTTKVLVDTITVSDAFSSVGGISYALSDSISLSDEIVITVNNQALGWYVDDPVTWYNDAPVTWYT